MLNLLGRIARFARFEVLTIGRFIRRFDGVRRVRTLKETNTVSVSWLEEHFTNPSITMTADGPVVAARLPTYRLSRLQRSMVRIPSRERTETFLLGPARDMEDANRDQQATATKMTISAEDPAREYEDARIFEWRGALWGLWTESTPLANGYCHNRMVLGRFEEDRIVELLPLVSPHGRDREKNWMPLVDGDRLFFMYSLERLEMYELVDGALEPVGPPTEPVPALQGQSGSSQFIPFEDGWLGVSHRGLIRPVALPWLPFGYYTHQLVALNRDFTLRSVSDPFYFLDRDVEFCAGLAMEGDTATFSFGSGDARAALLSLDKAAVRALLEPAA